jgi:Cdc6-like AAA superfamily ATPase
MISQPFLTFLGDCLINDKVPTNLFPQLQTRIESYLKSHAPQIPESFDDDQVLAATVESLHLENQNIHKTAREDIKIHLFKYAKSEGGRTLDLDSGSFYTLQSYPNEQQLVLWNSLHFEDNLKERLYSYIAAIFRFATCGLSHATSISFNRTILLHGPPGTGKSTLAKALVSRLSTRIWSMTGKYDKIVCFTVHSNQLFSRWFSESGKAIQTLFESIERLAGDETVVVAVIIDEIESLAMNRQRSIDSNEPTDSIRVRVFSRFVFFKFVCRQ